MKKLIFLISVISFFSVSLFAEVTIVNPCSGNFANPQTLVIESNEGEEIYYSFSGTDPLASGFAYDGPVLLDVTGNVELRVASIDKNLVQKEIAVSYSVTPNEIQNEEHKVFLSSLEKSAVVEYVAGKKIAIPFSLNYAFGDNRTFERGKEVSISKDCNVERYVPLSVRDENSEWRYVLHIVPSQMGQISQREVPFKISDWTKLEFTDAKMIYSLDGSWWYSHIDGITLDRSVPNTIYYQSAEFNSDNPVSKITLPPKPQLKVEQQYGGSIKVSIEENTFSAGSEIYKLASSPFAKTKVVADGLYSEILLDVFSGDKIEGVVPFDVYSEGVYQGTLFAKLDLNRIPPAIPTIKSSAKGFYSRENVDVVATAPKNLKLYVGISNPIEIPVRFDFSSSPEIKFDEPVFSPYDGRVITFFADTEKILAYQVAFYSEDSLGVKSQTVYYSMVVDKYNYYVDPASQIEAEDGTPFAPFRDLSKLSKTVNSNNFSRFCIKGVVQLPPGEVSLASNLELYGIGEAKLEIPDNSVIIMKNAGLFAENIALAKTVRKEPSKKIRGAAKALNNMFIIENSAATFSNCEIITDFSGDGKVFNLSSSVLSLKKTVISNKAQGYTAAVSAIGSKVNIADSRLLCLSDTGVGVSVSGGSFELTNTFIRVSARMARIAEFIDTNVSMEKNKFTAERTSQKTPEELIYVSGRTKIVKNEGNVLQ